MVARISRRHLYLIPELPDARCTVASGPANREPAGRPQILLPPMSGLQSRILKHLSAGEADLPRLRARQPVATNRCLGRVLINWVHVRFAPKATEILRCREMTRSANSDILRRSKQSHHCCAPLALSSSALIAVHLASYALCMLSAVAQQQKTSLFHLNVLITFGSLA